MNHNLILNYFLGLFDNTTNNDEEEPSKVFFLIICLNYSNFGF